MGWFELYVLIGAAFGILNLWAKKKLGEEVTFADVLMSIATIFLWLPFLIYYVIVWLMEYKKIKEEKELWDKIVKRAMQKIEEEMQKEGNDK